jgi:hypothetical protein
VVVVVVVIAVVMMMMLTMKLIPMLTPGCAAQVPVFKWDPVPLLMV